MHIAKVDKPDWNMYVLHIMTTTLIMARTFKNIGCLKISQVILLIH